MFENIQMHTHRMSNGVINDGLNYHNIMLHLSATTAKTHQLWMLAVNISNVNL